ncbi:MAG: hypothetical protein GY757_06770 [bacterium]|nr:hypothetical protein [bacterium]
MKKNTFVLILLSALVVSVATSLYLSNTSSVKAETTPAKQSKKLISELHKEQAQMRKEKERLEQMERNLKSFEIELDRKHDDYLQKEKLLADKEEEFKKKVEGKLVDRQIIETYESIDPEQAAILVKNLYLKDSSLATLVMRKIAGKKAGKILDAMIQLDKVTSTKIAEETLNYFKPKED